MTKLNSLRLKLLADSQNMLVAAQQGDWERLKELDLRWRELMDAEMSFFREELADIVPQLLLDNDQLQSYLLAEQQRVLETRQTGLKSLTQVKSYLVNN